MYHKIHEKRSIWTTIRKGGEKPHEEEEQCKGNITIEGKPGRGRPHFLCMKQFVLDLGNGQWYPLGGP